MLTTSFTSFARAKLHPITCDKPAVNFFSGALLGNGGLGAVVTTRPDAVVIHFGHNNVWDIRVAEEHQDEIGSFQAIFERVRQIPASYGTLEEDPWYKAYCDKMQANYRQPYPRPFPCGSLILGFDRRRVELLGHRLDIATGLCEVTLLADGAPVTLQLFTAMDADQLWLRTVDSQGQPVPAPFDRIRLMPDPDASKDATLQGQPAEGTATGIVFPRDADVPPDSSRFAALAEDAQGRLAFRQVLPFLEHGAAAHPKDRAFRLTVVTNGPLTQYSRINWHNQQEPMGRLERGLAGTEPFYGCVQLDEGLATALPGLTHAMTAPTADHYATARATADQQWAAYWSQSGVALSDEFLERIWYWNLYFLRCALRPGVTCPGLFANWSYRQIGIAWHGDYHMNYNTQQPFWATFSSNHVDLHLPYVDLVDHLLPISRQWAREYYGLRGAYFPHSAYPVEMKVMPYPVPTWGWEICETPWTVQSIWWHYLYTQDVAFLRSRAFGPLKEAVLFLVDYMQRPEAHGPQWGDDCYHIFPTVPPELYGLRPGFQCNHDCLVDLTLTKFVFQAFQQSCAILRERESEAALLEAVAAILAHFPAYPTAPSQRGEVFVSVPGENPEIVYNVPNSCMTVFPGEEHGLHSSPEEYALAANSYRNHRTEGGNELVFLNLQGARLGLLDLERFKRQINYCLLPNGTCTDLALQVHGRYKDVTAFDFMERMGIWLENFALPVVINECLLQSYNGELRLFPNWPLTQAAEFHTLRAVGAFLVSAACAAGQVQWVEIVSEAGAELTLLTPWPEGTRVTRAGMVSVLQGERLTLTTAPGEVIRLAPTPAS
ncbi:MAG: glycoside hydrolase N-terminal domain-containing protein [Caldilineaceae bacterium]